MKILLKTETEIEKMRLSGKILHETLKRLAICAKVGMQTSELEEIAQALLKEKGVRPAFVGFGGYPAALCVSVNEEAVHGVPGTRRLKDGDLVSVDLGVDYEGLITDAAITVGVGRITPVQQRLLETALLALQEGIRAAKVGNFTGDIGWAIQKVVEQAGFAVIRDLTGHGVGRFLHEDPAVPNFGRPKVGVPLRLGMTIAIEPIIATVPTEIKLARDGYTYLTTNGAHVVQVEHTIAIMKGGPEILT